MHEVSYQLGELVLPNEEGLWLADKFQSLLELIRDQKLHGEVIPLDESLVLDDLPDWTVIRFDTERLQNFRKMRRPAQPPASFRESFSSEFSSSAKNSISRGLLKARPLKIDGDHTNYLIGCIPEELLQHANRSGRERCYAPGYVAVPFPPASAVDHLPGSGYERKVWYAITLKSGTGSVHLFSFPFVPVRREDLEFARWPSHRPLTVGVSGFSQKDEGRFLIERNNSLIVYSPVSR